MYRIPNSSRISKQFPTILIYAPAVVNNFLKHSLSGIYTMA